MHFDLSQTTLSSLYTILPLLLLVLHTNKVYCSTHAVVGPRGNDAQARLEYLKFPKRLGAEIGGTSVDGIAQGGHGLLLLLFALTFGLVNK